MPSVPLDQPGGSPSLLLCSYEFGRGANAEGICTERLAGALLDRGWNITVATSRHSRPTLVHDRLRVIQYADRPGTVRVAQFLARKLRFHLEPCLIWRLRLSLARPCANASFIYGRAMPPCGLMAASALARRYRKPLGLHFSDPYPLPWEADNPLYGAKLKLARRLIQASVFVTFVTREALEFTQTQCKLNLEHKSFVLPHVAPEVKMWAPAPPAKTVFLYAGSFYGRRRPDVLLDGLALFLPDHASAEFHYVGRDTDLIVELAKARGLEGRVKTFPYTENITECFAGASVLVATDADDDQPVFLTTKIIEYLNTNRMVLLVSPAGSPGSKLIARFPETALRAQESARGIADAMSRLARMQPGGGDFTKRFREMETFSPAHIGEQFEKETVRRIGPLSH